MLIINAGGRLTFVRRRPFYVHFDWREYRAEPREPTPNLNFGGIEAHPRRTTFNRRFPAAFAPRVTYCSALLSRSRNATILCTGPRYTYKNVHTLYVAFATTAVHVHSPIHIVREHTNSRSSSGSRTGKYYTQNISSSK